MTLVPAYVRAFLWLTLRNHGSKIFILLTNIRMPPECTLRIGCVLEPVKVKNFYSAVQSVYDEALFKILSFNLVG